MIDNKSQNEWSNNSKNVGQRSKCVQKNNRNQWKTDLLSYINIQHSVNNYIIIIFIFFAVFCCFSPKPHQHWCPHCF